MLAYRKLIIPTLLVLLVLGGCAPAVSEPTEPNGLEPAVTPADIETAAPTAVPSEPESEQTGEGDRDLMPLITPTLPTEENAMPQATPDLLSSGGSALVDQARADLAGRLNISPAEIELVQFEAVTWPDGALGCPQPDMAYTQVPVDGSFIQLRAGGILYDYHSGGSRAPFLCEQVFRTKPTTAPLDLEDFLTPPAGGSDN